MSVMSYPHVFVGTGSNLDCAMSTLNDGMREWFTAHPKINPGDSYEWPRVRVEYGPGGMFVTCSFAIAVYEKLESVDVNEGPY